MNIMQRLNQYLSLNKRGAVEFMFYVFIGLSAFFIGFVVFFPNTVLQRKVQYEINRNFPGTILINSISYRFPFSMAADDVLITTKDSTLPEFRFDSVNISPHLASLIGNPGICFEAAAGDGGITGSFSSAGEFNIEISDYSFDYPVHGFTDLRLNGEITDARIESHMQTTPENLSVVRLNAMQLVLSGLGSAGLGVNRLNLGNLSINIDGKGNNLVISEAVLSGGEIQAEAVGRVVTGKSVRSTRINLDVQIKPAANLDTSVVSLIELIGSPAPDGSRKLNIGGTFARPRVK